MYFVMLQIKWGGRGPACRRAKLGVDICKFWNCKMGAR